MNESVEEPFLKFLEAGVEKGGFETDDALAALLPLMKQVHATHQAGLVAPLDGIKNLTFTEQGNLTFAADQAIPPKKNTSKVEALQSPVSSAVDVVAESRRTTDIDHSSLAFSDLRIGPSDAEVTKPIYLPGYRSCQNLLARRFTIATRAKGVQENLRGRPARPRA